MECSDTNKKINYRIIHTVRDEFIKSNYSVISICYCSTALSNDGLIRLKRFVSQISRKLCN